MTPHMKQLCQHILLISPFGFTLSLSTISTSVFFVDFFSWNIPLVNSLMCNVMCKWGPGFVYLKGTVHPKIQNMCFPSPGCELLSFVNIGHRDVWLLSNILELEGTQLVALKVKKIKLNNISLSELMIRFLKIIHSPFLSLHTRSEHLLMEEKLVLQLSRDIS